MSTLELIAAEGKLSLRDKTGPVWGVGFPLLLVIILGSIPALRTAEPANGGLSSFDIYVPVLILFNVAILALVALPTTLAGYRENGVLRRMATTPVGPARVLAAQLVANLATAVVAAIMVVTVAALGFGARLPQDFASFAFSWLLVTAAVLSIGLLITALVPGRGPAAAVGTMLYFPLMFFAGLWLPITEMPPLLQTISHYTPLGAGMRAFQDAYLGGFPSIQPVLTLVGYAAVCSFVAVRWFRWE